MMDSVSWLGRRRGVPRAASGEGQT
ncbi:hypothetical protein E8E01_08580 [Methylorubrum populi]|nr:hypothetical protein E8E01_08580 [Methylorubrum populi]